MNGSRIALLGLSGSALAEQLKKRGYETCHIGKWHLNSCFNSSKQPQPDDQGFDYWLATQNAARPSHKDPINFVRNGKEVGKIEGYSAMTCSRRSAQSRASRFPKV